MFKPGRRNQSYRAFLFGGCFWCKTWVLVVVFVLRLV